MNIKFHTALIIILGLSLTGSAYATSCTEKYPVRSVDTIGSGPTNAINSTMYAVFTGHITTDSGLTNKGKNIVKICEGTTVEYMVIGGTRTVYSRRSGLIEVPELASCVKRQAFGTLEPGDVLICNNRDLGGTDTDNFRVTGVRQ